MDGLRGDVGDVCYELLQIPAGLLQVGCVNDDLHQLQTRTKCDCSWTTRTHPRVCCSQESGSYLRQSYVRLLDEVLQTAAECSCQQQVGRLPQHVVNLC